MGFWDNKSVIGNHAIDVSGARDKNIPTDTGKAFREAQICSAMAGKKWTANDSLALGASIYLTEKLNGKK